MSAADDLAARHELGCVMHGFTERSQIAQVALGARCGCSPEFQTQEQERLRAMSQRQANSKDAVELTGQESDVLAKRLIARHLQADQDWLLWENLPNLSEQAFMRLSDSVTAYGDSLGKALSHYESSTGIDSAYLLEQATDG